MIASSKITLCGIGLVSVESAKNISKSQLVHFAKSVVKKWRLGKWKFEVCRSMPKDSARLPCSPWPAPPSLARLSPISSSCWPWLLPGALRPPSGRPPPACCTAGLAIYVQTPDQPHGGHYVIIHLLSDGPWTRIWTQALCQESAVTQHKAGLPSTSSFRRVYTSYESTCFLGVQKKHDQSVTCFHTLAS